jgi:hypothetical protein
MKTIMDIFSSVDFWKFAAPLLGAVVAWFVNEWHKRLADQYQRKEANYKELIKALRGFYVGANNAEALKLEFLNQLNAAWLYCPDDIIKKGYSFLDTVHAKAVHSDEAKEAAMGSFVVALRNDLLSRKLVSSTSLKATDFKHLNAK